MLICYPCGKKDTSFDIPDSVTTVGDSAFDNCKQLTSVKYQGTIEMWGKLDISEEWASTTPLTSVTCSNGTVLLK